MLLNPDLYAVNKLEAHHHVKAIYFGNYPVLLL